MIGERERTDDYGPVGGPAGQPANEECGGDPRGIWPLLTPLWGVRGSSNGGDRDPRPPKRLSLFSLRAHTARNTDPRDHRTCPPGGTVHKRVRGLLMGNRATPSTKCSWYPGVKAANKAKRRPNENERGRFYELWGPDPESGGVIRGLETSGGADPPETTACHFFFKKSEK